MTGKHSIQPQQRFKSRENSISPFEKIIDKKQDSAREEDKPMDDGASEKKARKKTLLQQSLKNNLNAIRNKIKSKDTREIIKEEGNYDSEDKNLMDDDKIIRLDDIEDTFSKYRNENKNRDDLYIEDIKVKLNNTIESPRKDDLHKRLRNEHKKLKIDTGNDDDVMINIPVKIELIDSKQQDSLIEDSTIKIKNDKLECHKCSSNENGQYKFMEKLVNLSKSLIRSIQWIDVCYHWIEKKYSINKKENEVKPFDNLEMPKNIHTIKENSNLLKTTDYNFKLLVKAIMGITVATQNTPFYDLLNKHTYKLKDFLKERLYTLEDYGITNNETFYIKEYAPVIFSNIRTIYGMSKKEYLASISPEGFLTELMISSNTIIEQLISTSKSGSMFFYTKDGKMIIKTIPKKEFDFLTKILINYFNHLKNNRYSLLPRIFGCYRLLRICNQEITPLYFITMDNIFCTNRQIHIRYDLKGSTKGRQVLKKGSKLTGQKISFALKDLDLLNNKNYFHVDPNRRAKILEEIKKDSKFLADNSIIDYSLLIGIHLKEGETNKEIFKEPNAINESFEKRPKIHTRQYNDFERFRQDLNMSEYSNLKIDHEIFTHSESQIEKEQSAHIFKDVSNITI